jgi:hypothetical protein
LLAVAAEGNESEGGEATVKEREREEKYTRTGKEAEQEYS